jgi:hypothetical protein
MRGSQVIYRHATMNDIEAMVDLELKVWGKDMAANRARWISRINIFSEGTWVAEKDNQIVGVVVGHIIKWDYPENYFPTWEEATANGYITNHNNQGYILYGVDLTVLSKNPCVAETLIRRDLEVAREKRLLKTIFGCRIPSLANSVKFLKHQPSETEMMQLALMDVEVKFFMSFGFKVMGLKKDYYKKDAESLGRGLILFI